jgi:hypothetical protein
MAKMTGGTEDWNEVKVWVRGSDGRIGGAVKAILVAQSGRNRISGQSPLTGQTRVARWFP